MTGTHSESNPDEGQPLLSIGAVARQSSLSEATLRVWERRYGFPSPVRLPSGHRRYPVDQVQFLRLVAEGLTLGLRPGRLLRMDRNDLELLLNEHRPDDVSELWNDIVSNFRADELRQRLEDLHLAHGLPALFDDHVGPLLAWVGTSWACGGIDVRHEHFVTESLLDFMRSLRVMTPSIEREESRGMVVIVTLPGERHGLGLQMFAALCDAIGIGFRCLGVDLPLEDIASTAEQLRAEAIAVSLPLSDRGPKAYRLLRDLRKLTPDAIELVVGGSGALRVRRSPSHVTRLISMGAADTWLRELRVRKLQETRQPPARGQDSA